jgi:hypothetical protein
MVEQRGESTVSLARDLEEMQWRSGLAHKPDHLIREEQARELDGAGFASHAREAYHALDPYSAHSDERVAAVAAGVVEDMRRDGRDMTPTRDLAEAVATATSNRLAGFTGAGRGLGTMFGGTFREEEQAPETGSAAAIAAEQKRLFGGSR